MNRRVLVQLQFSIRFACARRVSPWFLHGGIQKHPRSSVYSLRPLVNVNDLRAFRRAVVSSRKNANCNSETPFSSVGTATPRIRNERTMVERSIRFLTPLFALACFRFLSLFLSLFFRSFFSKHRGIRNFYEYYEFNERNRFQFRFRRGIRFESRRMEFGRFSSSFVALRD